MSKFEKAKKNLKNDMIVLFILGLFALGCLVYFGDIKIFSIGFVVLLFVGYSLAKKGSKSAGIIGIIVGVIMMLKIITGNIIVFLLGLIVVIHSSKYLKNF